MDEYLRNSGEFARRSPYLLGIGKAVVGLAEALQDIRGRSCPSSDVDNGHDGGNCTESQFRPEPRPEIRDSDVYEALRVQASSRSVRYAVTMKTRHDLVEVASYVIRVSDSRATPEKAMSGLPELCLRDRVGNCDKCVNFRERSHANVVTKGTTGKSVLKSNVYVPICLIAVVCGSLACCVIVVFIVHRFAIEWTRIDGNPSLTIALVMANVFTLLTALPFLMADDYFGAESLNAWKILLVTLAFGLTFSILLSRALFLAADSVFVDHVNGYLQSALIFFMVAVQLAMSIMYFFLNTTDSAAVARSPVFVALLGYDIFLLIALFVACCFIMEKNRDCREEKYFFGTAICLLAIWGIWLICFVSIQPENRDAVVCLGVIGTAYSIILGILMPRVYYMMMHPPRTKDFERRLKLVSLTNDSTLGTIQQSRSAYARRVRESRVLREPPTYPNYYGSPGPSLKCLDRYRDPIQREMPRYSNYGFHAEMAEIEIACAAPQARMENAEASNRQIPQAWKNLRLTPDDVIYAQPKVCRAYRVVLSQERETGNTCDKGDFPLAHKLQNEPYPVRYAIQTNVGRRDGIDGKNENEDADEGEEDDEVEGDRKDQDVSRVTRF